MQPQQQQTVVTSAVPVVQPVYVSQPYQTAYEVNTYAHRQSAVIGILLIVGGCLSIVFNVVDLAVGVGYYWYDLSLYSNGVAGHGFWCGVLVSIKVPIIPFCVINVVFSCVVYQKLLWNASTKCGAVVLP